MWIFAAAVFLFRGVLIVAVKEDTAPKNMTSDCILHILHKYLGSSKKIAVKFDYDNEEQEFVVGEIFRLSQKPVTLNTEELHKGTELDRRLPNDAVIMLNQHVNLTYYLESNLYTADTVFLTVIWEKPCNLSELFEEFWRYNVVNTFALEMKTDEIDVYYFIPYVNCDESRPLLLDKWVGNSFRYGLIKRVREKRTVTHLGGCRFNVSVANVPPITIFPDESKTHGSERLEGVEGRVLATIAEKLNCSFTYKVADDGEKWGFVKPEPIGPVGDVYLKRSYIACGNPSPVIGRMVYLDIVVGSVGASECVVWVAPSGVARDQSEWLGVFVLEFSPTTWVFFTGVLITATLAYYFFSRAVQQPPRITLFDSFLVLLSSSLGKTVRTTTSVSMNTLFGVWIWYALIILVAYESEMRSKLTVPLRHKDIDTVKELIDLEFDLYAVETTLKILYKGADTPVERAVWERAKPTNATIEEMLDEVVRTRRVGFMRERTPILYAAFQKKITPLIHPLEECPYFYYPTMYLQRRCPVTHLIRSITMRLWQSGILRFWRSLYIREARPIQPAVVKLTREHMTAPFVAFAVGMILSTTVFICELLTHLKTRYKFRKR